MPKIIQWSGAKPGLEHKCKQSKHRLFSGLSLLLCRSELAEMKIFKESPVPKFYETSSPVPARKFMWPLGLGHSHKLTPQSRSKGLAESCMLHSFIHSFKSHSPCCSQGPQGICLWGLAFTQILKVQSKDKAWNFRGSEKPIPFFSPGASKFSQDLNT